MEEKTEVNENCEVLISVKEIEGRLKKSYINLVSLRSYYNFPLRKTGGLPSVNLKEFEAWVLRWGRGLPWHEITSAVLQNTLQLEKIEAMLPKELTGINAIADFTGSPLDEVQNWFRNGINCPIRKDEKTKVYSVDAKELMKWCHSMGISRHREERSFDSF